MYVVRFSPAQSLEVRLHRALEEVSKHKETTRQARGQNKELSQGQRLEVARLETQCRRLERQKVRDVGFRFTPSSCLFAFLVLFIPFRPLQQTTHDLGAVRTLGLCCTEGIGTWLIRLPD